MTYAWTVPAFGATPVVATAAERQAVIDSNARLTREYRALLTTWQGKRDQYLQQQAVYNATVARQEADYQAAVGRYNQALTVARGQAAAASAALASQQAAYGAAVRARTNQIAQNKTNADRVLAGAAYPPGFVQAGYCATSAEVASWRNYCAPVRGLGANEPYCAWQNLAVCSVPPLPPLPAPVPQVAMPTPPVKAAPPAPPRDPGPAPRAPVLAEVPTVAPPPPAKRPPPDRPMAITPPLPPVRPSAPERAAPALPPPPDFVQPKKQNLAVWGILALVLVGGAGGAYWYSKKQKAKAA